jgi:signal transduction histidine kinase
VLLLAVLVSWRVARWAIDPLERLDEQAARLGRGDLQARAATTSGPPEIVALAATFNQMADQLDELVTSQRRFVADASHQLRTPLTALRLRLETLDPDDAAAVGATRDAALEETSRLTRLVDGLLALARSERRREERHTVDVGAVVVERREAWAPLATENGIDLRVDATGNGRAVTALVVPGHLEQILDNLIDNAVDVTPDGGVVHLTYVTAGPVAEIHVVDDGPGMSAEERARAFDPFWQGSNRHANGSAGLGLAIVDQLARGSGGTVALDASATGGIDAVVRVPLAPAG